MILGINFLTKYHTILNYFNKEVLLRDPGKFEVNFVGERKVELASIILVFNVRKMIKKGHIAYRTLIVDTQGIRNDPISLPTVCDYLDVFSKEMNGLP